MNIKDLTNDELIQLFKENSLLMQAIIKKEEGQSDSD